MILIMRIKSFGLFRPKMRLFVALAVLLTSSVFFVDAQGEARADAPPAGFVSRDGRYLMLDGEPYRFTGFNAFGITGCATGKPWTRTEMDAYFAQLPPESMTRTWAFEYYGVQQLELLVARAEAHGQKLILSLANAGADCGEGKKDNEWYAGGYRDQYLSWVRTIVTRFRDSPAIGMWEIMNEPGHQSTVNNATMKAFFDEAAATIKSIDPYHLVGTGSMAAHTPGTTDFGFVHSGPNIDVASLHEYDQDHSDQVLSRHLPRTLMPLYQLNKPLIIGETGMLAAPGCPLSLAQRAGMFQREFDGYFLSGVAGVLVWTYSPNPSVDATCMHQVRAADADPAIAMIRNYQMPKPVTAPRGPVRLQVRHSGKCVTVPGAATTSGVVAQQQACTGAKQQRFTFQPTSDGYYRIVAHSGKCLDVRGQSYALDALVHQWDCWNGPNQQVRLEPAGSGYYRLIFRNSNQCLRVLGGSTAENASMSQYDCKTPTLGSQQFRLT